MPSNHIVGGTPDITYILGRRFSPYLQVHWHGRFWTQLKRPSDVWRSCVVESDKCVCGTNCNTRGCADASGVWAKWESGVHYTRICSDGFMNGNVTLRSFQRGCAQVAVACVAGLRNTNALPPPPTGPVRSLIWWTPKWRLPARTVRTICFVFLVARF